VIGDDALTVGPVTVSFLDADVVRSADYRIALDIWPDGRLVLSQLGRRFDTFVQELRRVRNQARVAGMLAHGLTMPEVFSGVVGSEARNEPAEIQVYDTHVTVVPSDGDPWQLPLGALTAVRAQDEPPAVVLETNAGLTIIGQLGRRRDACQAAIVERREVQRRLLAEVTGQNGFSDGWGLAQSEIRDFEQVLERFSAPERATCCRVLVAAATKPARLGFVQLLDPDRERLGSPAPLPENWAVFLLVPVGALTVLEIMAGPAAATYVFRGEIDAVGSDLQLLHFRRAPLALTAEQAQLTPSNPHRLALRRLEPLQRLRSTTVARVIHNDGWTERLRVELLPHQTEHHAD
jgi:hypothetical protein